MFSYLISPRRSDRTSETGTTVDDILYHNIGMGFLEAVRTFRRLFFVGDKFLPKPFHYEELRRAFETKAKQDDSAVRAAS